MTARAVVLLLVVACWRMPAARAQEDKCDLRESVQVDRQELGGISMIYIQGPFLVQCTSGAELRANQGTVNQVSGEIFLTGNVSYRDATRSLTSDQATYTRPIRRLYATGNVVYTDRAEGTTIRGPELEYFATMPGRPEAQVNAGQRPHLTLQPKEQRPGREKGEPLEVDADRLTILGKNDLSAYGNVVITRPDLDARAEEARYNGDTEGLELRRNAVIKGQDNTLRAEVIQAQLRDNALEDVRARTRAVLEAKDLTVNAPDLHLFFKDELLQRTVARTVKEAPTERAVALSRTFRLEADSIDALAPGQKLDQVIAIGRARGETIDTTRADSARVAAVSGAAASPADSARRSGAASPTELVSRDWILGDTIVGYFAQDTARPVASARSDTSVVLQRLVARGAAQSLYRVEEQGADKGAQTPPTGRRAINFVSAAVINLRFKEGEVDVAELTQPRRGLYLDPAPPAAPAAATPPSPTAAARPGGP